MRSRTSAITIVCLILYSAAPGLAAARSDRPGETAPARVAGAPPSRAGTAQATIAGGVGKPSGLALYAPWVGSNDRASDYETDVAFTSTEDLFYVVWLTTQKTKDITCDFKVTDSSKNVVGQDSTQLSPAPNSLIPVVFNIGPLPQDFYLLAIKCKQGKAKVKTSAWVITYVPI